MASPAHHISTAREPMVTVAHGGKDHDYPDRLAEFKIFLAEGGQFGSSWGADKSAGTTLIKNRMLDSIEMWVSLDDQPVVYLVRYIRKGRNSTVAKATIIGAAKLGLVVVETIEGTALAEPYAKDEG